VLPFDTVQQITRGNPLRARAFLDYLNPAKGVFTALAEQDAKIVLAGQVTHTGTSRSSNLSFIAPGRGMTSESFPELLEFLIEQAGKWGTFHFLVETDEHSNSFDVFRAFGFSVYAWQRVWKFKTGSSIEIPADYGQHWSQALDRDQVAVRSLCQSLVPALVQPVENVFDKRVSGWVCRNDCNLIGYADIIQGREGIWVQPYIHPETEQVDLILCDLLNQLQQKSQKPVSICVRSYQAWIESALEELPVLASPRQALLVKHLALIQPASIPVTVPNFEKNQTKASVVHSEMKQEVL
jgi:hypothetical protein